MKGDIEYCKAVENEKPRRIYGEGKICAIALKPKCLARRAKQAGKKREKKPKDVLEVDLELSSDDEEDKLSKPRDETLAKKKKYNQ
ncbi:unnamed protein product [Strongylus vulgaris]|uniref:Uncharacterized protein n=1 Tax=Strongylus vulgaris TaxID=40348 RepID=A0A3P7JDE0_STRVU|nr:unnamed protein product [Strongylus vulgaris]